LAQTGKQDSAEWKIECPDNVEFNFDADRVRNALEELLDNSRQMLPPGEMLRLGLQAEIETRDGRQWLSLRFWDNGPGIPIEKRDRVFEPFFSERPYGKRSTGLGLNFVRRVAEAHGGAVRITGKPGVGAEFVIEVPKS